MNNNIENNNPQITRIMYKSHEDGIELADGTEIKASDDILKSSGYNEKLEEKIRFHYLNIDNFRSRVGSYNENKLDDPNIGHWDLWELKKVQDKLEEDGNADDFEYYIDLKKDMYARNPKFKLNTDGVVSIDFGTKSTVAVKSDKFGNAIPIQIGIDKRTSKNNKNDYENPTIL